MKLIADSGSTKTHWVLLNGSEETHCSTVGLNPLLVDEPFFLKEVESACRMLPCEAERVAEPDAAQRTRASVLMGGWVGISGLPSARFMAICWVPAGQSAEVVSAW